jgi:hypothetical protein
VSTVVLPAVVLADRSVLYRTDLTLEPMFY